MRNGYAHMVQDDLTRRVRAYRRLRVERFRAVETRGEAFAYRDRIRRSLHEAFGPWPERTPLNARVTGRTGTSGCIIEKVIFESRPGDLVPGLLYLPRDLVDPAPCVLGLMGHSSNGKTYAVYQAFPQRLAQAGFVVLTFDPLGQGERDQYGADPVHKRAVPSSPLAHNMASKQLALVGECYPMWHAWDGIRALDYLLGRPEVDPSRVGVTGVSGGGTMSTWLFALDERIQMGAPACFVKTYLDHVENEIPSDAENIPPGLYAAGVDIPDALMAQAPKPLLVLGERYDFTDRRGLRSACEDLERFYGLLGASANFQTLVGDSFHGYEAPLQQKMVRFFAEHAGLTPRPEARVEVLPDSELWATPEGDVLRAGGTPIWQLVAHRAAGLRAQRSPNPATKMRAQLGMLLQLPEAMYKSTTRDAPHYRTLRAVKTPQSTHARYAIETERDIRAIMRKKLGDPRRCHTLDVEAVLTLYLPHFSAEEDLDSTHAMALVPEDGPLYAVDVRGLGESAPDEDNSFWYGYGVDYQLYAYGLLLDECYVGRRVVDVLRILDLLYSEGAKEVTLSGRGQGALLALYTALLDERIRKVVLVNAPTSFEEWASTPVVDWPATNAVFGILRHFDVGDLVRVLGDRVTLQDSWGPQMEVAAPDVCPKGTGRPNHGEGRCKDTP